MPGTRLLGLKNGEETIGPEGSYQTELSFGESYFLNAEVPGYNDVEMDLTINVPETTVFLNQKSLGRFSYDLYLAGFSYPGFAVSFHLVPDWAMVRLDTFTYALGFVPYADPGDQEENLFVSEPLSHLSVWWLQHVTDRRREYRPYFGIGATTRLFHSSEALELEPVSRFGFTAAVGVEMARGRHAWFFEYAPLFYLVDEPEMWEQQLGSGQWGYIRVGDNAIDLFMVRAGFRLYP